MKSYQDIHKNDIDAQRFNILIVTATDTETKAFHEVMTGNVLRVICGDYTYYLGHVGQYNVIHVQCSQMGSLSPGGSSQTTNVALLRDWPQIKAVIMVGICFGVDNKSQQIGDVVVATSIKNYETRRVGKKKEISRGGTYQADKCLCNAFNNLKLTWENIGIDDKKKKLVLGEYISGEQLVDNIENRNKLLSETPEAKAGEMEGNGIIAACVSARTPWILVKAICDFADGKKGKDKKTKQAIAAASSSSCCSAVLEQATAFETLGIYPINYHEVTIGVENPDVLFELYRKEYAPYFLRREIDNTVESYLQGHSLWIYGISGAGKSTSISHALQTMGKSILLVNMAGISPNSTLEEIFEWIYNDVAEVVREKSIAPHSYQLSIKSIIALLDKHYAGQQVYVLVEEIPFEGESFKTFVTSFSSLVVTDKLTGTSADVHFVLSSIDNPTPYVSGSLQKVRSMVKFLEFEHWSKEECVKLIELIKKNLRVPIITDTTELISMCGNLPRPIKAVFREAYQTGFLEELDSNHINILLRQL